MHCVNKQMFSNSFFFLIILFPNLISLSILNLSSLNNDFLNDICDFIQNNKNSKIVNFVLGISSKYQISNMLEQNKIKYYQKLKGLGFNVKHSNVQSMQMIVIQK